MFRDSLSKDTIMKYFLILYFVMIIFIFALLLNLARCSPRQGIKTYYPYKLECDCWGKYCPECWDKETQELMLEDTPETVEDSSQVDVDTTETQ